MYWIIVLALIAICTIAGFLVGIAYGQEHWNEHL